jgi:Tfp pilus assembly protein PilO
MQGNKKILIASIIFGLIALLLICFVISPLLRGIKEDSEEIVALKKDLILFQNKINNFEEAKESYENMKSSTEKIERLFIDPSIPIDLIEFWERIARESEVSIDISPVFLKSSETDPWNSISFQLTLTGSSPNFLEFLEKIETSPHLIEIQNLNVKKTKTESLKNDVNAILIAKIYTN